MKRVLPALTSLLLTIAIPTTTWAHGTSHAEHGGVVKKNGEILFELVRTPAGVSLYVTDEDEPVAASGMTAQLNITVGGQRSEIAMASGDGNQFMARGLILPKGANVGVMVISKASQARYGTTFAIN